MCQIRLYRDPYIFKLVFRPPHKVSVFFFCVCVCVNYIFGDISLTLNL